MQPNTLGMQRLALLRATLDLWWPDEPLVRAVSCHEPTAAELAKVAAGHLRSVLRVTPDPEAIDA